MSTTFGVTVPSIEVEDTTEVIEVALRFGNEVNWINPIAQLLSDNIEVIAMDNSNQGINTIGDLKHSINK